MMGKNLEDTITLKGIAFYLSSQRRPSVYWRDEFAPIFKSFTISMV